MAELTVPKTNTIEGSNIEKTVSTPMQLQPLKSDGFQPTNTPTGLQPTNQPTLQDFISEAQKLGQQSVAAQGDILRGDINKTAEALGRNLIGRNVSLEGGLGQKGVTDTLTAQAQRLEPYAIQVGTQIAQQALQKQYERADQATNKMFDLAKSGQLKGSALETAVKNATNGMVDDISMFLTDDQAALEQYAASKGLAPTEALQIRQMTGELLKQDMVAHPERYAGLAVDPDKEYAKQLELARSQGGGGGMCFITTACCDLLGLPDDNNILNTFRKFRDEYMDGKEGVKEYYDIAPKILHEIEYLGDKKYLLKVTSKYLIPAYSLIIIGKNEEAKKLYKKMVGHLVFKYLTLKVLNRIKLFIQIKMSEKKHG